MRSKDGKDKWACSFGCNQAFYLKRGGTGCPHLERLLPPITGSSKNRPCYTGHRLEQDSDSSNPETLLLAAEEIYALPRLSVDPEPIDQDQEMHKALTAKGLPPKKAWVVIDRNNHDLTYREIALERGYSSASAAHRAYKDAVEFLSSKDIKGFFND